MTVLGEPFPPLYLTPKLAEVLAQIQDPPKVSVLRLGAVPVLDATGMHALREVQARFRRLGTVVLLCG